MVSVLRRMGKVPLLPTECKIKVENKNSFTICSTMEKEKCTNWLKCVKTAGDTLLPLLSAIRISYFKSKPNNTIQNSNQQNINTSFLFRSLSLTLALSLWLSFVFSALYGPFYPNNSKYSISNPITLTLGLCFQFLKQNSYVSYA